MDCQTNKYNCIYNCLDTYVVVTVYIIKRGGIYIYTPIAKQLHQMPQDTMAKLQDKFDIVRFVQNEKLAFSDYF